MHKPIYEWNEDEDDVPVLIVGRLCDNRHHRSATFTELLREIKWLEDRDIHVTHYDLTKEGKEGERESRQKCIEEETEDAEASGMAQRSADAAWN